MPTKKKSKGSSKSQGKKTNSNFIPKYNISH